MGGPIIENFLQLVGNYFFPMVLSVYLIYRIDKLMTDLVTNQKDFADRVCLELKDIKQDILNIRFDISAAIKK